MDSSFVRCCEEEGYEQRLAALLGEVRCRTTVLTVVDTDLLCFVEDLSHLYFVINRSNWDKEFHFEARV